MISDHPICKLLIYILFLIIFIIWLMLLMPIIFYKYLRPFIITTSIAMQILRIIALNIPHCSLRNNILFWLFFQFFLSYVIIEIPQLLDFESMIFLFYFSVFTFHFVFAALSFIIDTVGLTMIIRFVIIFFFLHLFLQIFNFFFQQNIFLFN